MIVGQFSAWPENPVGLTQCLVIVEGATHSKVGDDVVEAVVRKSELFHPHFL